MVIRTTSFFSFSGFMLATVLALTFNASAAWTPLTTVNITFTETGGNSDPLTNTTVYNISELEPYRAPGGEPPCTNLATNSSVGIYTNGGVYLGTGTWNGSVFNLNQRFTLTPGMVIYVRPNPLLPGTINTLVNEQKNNALASTQRVYTTSVASLPACGIRVRGCTSTNSICTQKIIILRVNSYNLSATYTMIPTVSLALNNSALTFSGLVNQNYTLALTGNISTNASHASVKLTTVAQSENPNVSISTSVPTAGQWYNTGYNSAISLNVTVRSSRPVSGRLGTVNVTADFP